MRRVQTSSHFWARFNSHAARVTGLVGQADSLPRIVEEQTVSLLYRECAHFRIGVGIMIRPRLPEQGSATVQEARLLDRICDRFEAEWQSCRRPQIEHYIKHYFGLAPVPPRALLFRELFALEIEYLRQSGEQPSRSAYLHRFPEYAEIVQAAFGEAGHELTAPAPRACNALRAAPSDYGDLAGKTRIAREPPVSPPCFPVRVLGDYELLEELGKGGMGIVYRARQLSANRTVALKMIRPDRLEDLTAEERQEWLARFRREAQIAALVQHDSVVTVYEVCQIEGQLFYAMRLVEGRNLADVIREGPLPSRRAATSLETMARALASVHALGVVHRDLKPRNILVDALDRPFVSDFGLARWSGPGGDLTRRTAWLGTPSYIAPEQAQDPTRATAASDIYSLGAILYEMLTGRPPFQAADPVETLRQVISVDPVAPRRLNPAIDRDLELVCLQCLRKEPTRRYASALQLADEVQRYVRRQPLRHTRPMSPTARLARWAGRNRALAAAATLAVLALLAFTILFASFEIQKANAHASLVRAHRDSREISAYWALECGVQNCERGDAGLGLLWLTRALETAPEDAGELRWTIRANLGAWQSSVNRLESMLVHEGKVLAVAVSPDGRTVATGCSDKIARLWDAATGKVIGPPLEHPGQVVAVAFTGDGKSLITVDSHNKARTWDLRTQQLRELPGLPQGHPLGLTAASEGSIVLSQARDQSVNFWKANIGKSLDPPLGTGVGTWCAAVRGDGKTVMTGGAGGKAQLWDTASWRPIGEPLINSTCVKALALSPDGKLALIGYADRTTQMWDLATGRPIGDPLYHEGEVTTVGFSPDSLSFLTGSKDGTARLWQTASRTPLGSPVRHAGAVLAAAFSPNHSMLVTASADKTARVWQIAKGRPSSPLATHEQSINAIAFTRKGDTLMTAGSEGGVQMWTRHSRRPFGNLLRNDGRVITAAFSPDGRTIAAAGEDGRLNLWDRTTGRRQCQIRAQRGWIRVVVFRPDGKAILVAGDDSAAQQWDVATGAPLGPQLRHRKRICATAFSPDGSRIVTGSEDGTAQLWNAATGEPLGPLLRHDGWVVSVAFNPNGGAVLTASADGTARIWDSASGYPLTPPLVHQGALRGAIFSPDGSMVATASADRTARLWDTATGRRREPALPHRNEVTDVAFSPDGAFVATASLDGTARLWAVSTGKAIGPPMRHPFAVSHVLFSPDGMELLTAGTDSTARLWQRPEPMQGEIERIRLWTEVISGMELDPTSDWHDLDPQTWNQRRLRLQELGGPPPH